MRRFRALIKKEMIHKEITDGQACGKCFKSSTEIFVCNTVLRSVFEAETPLRMNGLISCALHLAR